MKSILLIDRSRESADSVESVLRQYDFHVEVADDETAARRLAKEGLFDLILMELLLRPEAIRPQCIDIEALGEHLGKSTALIREIRAIRVSSPIIIYTTLRGDLYETAALDAGADDYILKTGHCSVLLARLHAHLRRRQRDLGIAAGEDRRTSIGRFVIDRRTRILLSDVSPVQLTGKEVALLERLAANPYRTVSLTETLDHVWGEELGRSQDALEALIQRLRRKMERHRLPNPIQTIRGQGLKLAAAFLPQAAMEREVPARHSGYSSAR